MTPDRPPQRVSQTPERIVIRGPGRSANEGLMQIRADRSGGSHRERDVPSLAAGALDSSLNGGRRWWAVRQLGNFSGAGHLPPGRAEHRLEPAGLVLSCVGSTVSSSRRNKECSCDPAMLAGASPCSRSRTSPPFSLRELQGEGRHEEDRQVADGAVARSGRIRRPAWSGGTRRPVSDARCMSATAPLTRATDHRCDSCGYQISTSQPFPRCPMCGGHSWRLIAVTHQVLVRAGKPYREAAR
jgi:hypothetical protein